MRSPAHAPSPVRDQRQRGCVLAIAGRRRVATAAGTGRADAPALDWNHGPGRRSPRPSAYNCTAPTSAAASRAAPASSENPTSTCCSCRITSSRTPTGPAPTRMGLKERQARQYRQDRGHQQSRSQGHRRLAAAAETARACPRILRRSASALYHRINRISRPTYARLSKAPASSGRTSARIH